MQACVNCGAGTYSSEGASCTNCAPGKYSMTTGASTADTCATCTPNSTLSKEGSAACECASGRASAFDVVIMSVCATCVCQNPLHGLWHLSMGTYLYSGIYGDQPYFTHTPPGELSRYLYYINQRWYVNRLLGNVNPLSGPIFLRSQTISIELDFNFNILTWEEGGCRDTWNTVGNKYDWVRTPFISSVQTHTSACLACVPGKYAAATGASVCRNCVEDTYSPTVGASSCLSCPSNFVSPSGSDALSSCKCNLGYYGPLEGDCAECPANTYTSVPGSAGCSACPENSVSPNRSTAASSCRCRPGYSGPNGGVCSACAVGTYKKTNGSLACSFCEVHYNGTTEAAVDATSCFAAPQPAAPQPPAFSAARRAGPAGQLSVVIMMMMFAALPLRC